MLTSRHAVPQRKPTQPRTGGHGIMWDGVANAEVTRLVESAHAAGGVVAAVGHGTAALLDATGADGKPIIAGRQVGRHGLGKTSTR